MKSRMMVVMLGCVLSAGIVWGQATQPTGEDRLDYRGQPGV